MIQFLSKQKQLKTIKGISKLIEYKLKNQINILFTIY